MPFPNNVTICNYHCNNNPAHLCLISSMNSWMRWATGLTPPKMWKQCARATVNLQTRPSKGELLMPEKVIESQEEGLDAVAEHFPRKGSRILG